MIKQKWVDWLLRKKKAIFIVSVIIALAVALPVGLTTSKTIAAYISGILVAIIPNVVVLYKLAEGVWQTMRVGWRQMDMLQKLKDEQITSLLRLENRQRDSIRPYLKTHIESISYTGLAESAPYIGIQVNFSNFSVFSGKIKRWHIKHPTYLVFRGQPYRMRPQFQDMDTDIWECLPRSLKFELLEVDELIVDCIKKASNAPEHIEYLFTFSLSIEFNRYSDNAYEYEDRLEYKEIPIVPTQYF